MIEAEGYVGPYDNGAGSLGTAIQTKQERLEIMRQLDTGNTPSGSFNAEVTVSDSGVQRLPDPMQPHHLFGDSQAHVQSHSHQPAPGSNGSHPPSTWPQ